MWQNRFPKLAGMVSSGSAGAPIAPVGESQPAMATKSMGLALKPTAVPSQLPKVPMLAAHPDMDEKIKHRALMNIAMGHKGF